MGTQLQIEGFIRTWEKRCYPDGVPDEVPVEIDHLVPSYKQIAIALLKNDLSKIIPQKESIYYGMLKRIEIAGRKNSTIQLRLFP